MSLTDAHQALLEARGIPAEAAIAAGVRSVTDADQLPEGCPNYWTVASGYLPAILFPWVGPDGHTEYQIRPDDDHRPVDQHGRAIKYATRSRDEGYQPVLWVARRGDADGLRLLTEGTCQTLAAAAAAPKGTWVLGMIGCRGWMDHGSPLVDLSLVEGAPVVVALDADLWTNRNVWDAGATLQRALEAEGATSVRFLQLAAGSHTGLDDVLGTRAVDRRTDYLGRLLALAPVEKFPPSRRPKADANDVDTGFFDENGLLVRELAHAVYERNPMLLTQEQRLAVYRGGVYCLDGTALISSVTTMLGDAYRRAHSGSVEDMLVGELATSGHYLPARSSVPLINVANGMLDPLTEELHEHDPDYWSSVQLPVEWDPQATCPTYEAWAARHIGDQLDDLEESLATMLDPTRVPTKAVFLYGEPRTGKGTVLRLAEAMVGSAHRSSVTLQQLSTDRFAAANLFGSVLNTAGDLSAAHVEDLSLFKMATGEDSILANRKYGAQFSFTNQALFLFAANELPTVSENSRAYLERMKPFRFEHSFAGAEDHRVQQELEAELPGIFARWVRAYQRFVRRGGYQATEADIQHEFETSSDRVRLWVSEEMQIVSTFPDGGTFSAGSILPPECATPPRDLAREFNRWAEENGGSKIGERKVTKRLTSMDGVHEVRIAPMRKRGLNLVKRSNEGGGEGKSGTFGPNGACGKKESRGLEETFSFPSEGVRAKSATTAVNGYSGDLYLDLETASADQLWRRDQGFIRLCGFRNGSGEVRLTSRAESATAAVKSATRVVGHNVLGFDLLALAHHHGLDVVNLTCENRVWDTQLAASLANPPPARMNAGQINRRYSLENVCERYGLEGKHGDLKALAKEFGGYDQIPLDDERYREYLRGDVELTSQLAQQIPVTDYARREHRIAGIAAQITLNGFRVDLDLLETRLQHGRARRAELLDHLQTAYGLPTTKKDGKPSKSPQATQEGLEAIAAAFRAAGATHLPKTKTGRYSVSQYDLDRVKEVYADLPGVIEIADVVQELNGIRTVFETINDHRVGDRVHPMIQMRQASGRWSTTQPGLTVIGKRGGRHQERHVFLPEPGQKILSVDLSQVDARAVAALSEDTAYQELFTPGRDIHAEVAQQIWGDSSRREEAKLASHGWNYGLGIQGMAAQAGVTEEVAAEFDRGMRERFPRLIAWREEVHQRAEAGELLDNGFGRLMRPSPDRAFTQGPALMGQGCARDLMMEGLLRLPRELLPHVRAVVHDEVVLSVPADNADDIARTVVDALSFEWRGVPILADALPTGHTWGEVYDK